MLLILIQILTGGNAEI